MERNIGKHVAGSNVVIPDVGQLMKLMKVNIMITNGRLETHETLVNDELRVFIYNTEQQLPKQ